MILSWLLLLWTDVSHLNQWFPDPVRHIVEIQVSFSSVCTVCFKSSSSTYGLCTLRLSNKIKGNKLVCNLQYTQGGLGEFKTVMQTLNYVLGLHKFQEFSKHPESLDEAMLTCKKCSIAFIKYRKFSNYTQIQNVTTASICTHLNTPIDQWECL